MACIFNVEGRPVENPTTTAQCALNWAALGIIWDALGCLGKQSTLFNKLCYEYPAVEDFDEIQILKSDLSADLEECYINLVVDGQTIGTDATNPDIAIFYTLVENITYWSIQLNNPVGTAEALSDIKLDIFEKVTFETLFTCDDRSCD